MLWWPQTSSDLCPQPSVKQPQCFHQSCKHNKIHNERNITRVDKWSIHYGAPLNEMLCKYLKQWSRSMYWSEKHSWLIKKKKQVTDQCDFVFIKFKFISIKFINKYICKKQCSLINFILGKYGNVKKTY